MPTQTVAFVGAAGGTGTTRTTLESATLLAGEGRDVALLDAAFGTQGLADETPGRVDPDATALYLGDEPLETGLVDVDVDGAGRLAVCPARAPFERLARAKSPEAAESLETRLTEAARAFDHVLVDTPPIASNPAVAAVDAVETVAVVADAERAAAAVPRMEDRLADVGVVESVTIVTQTDDHPDADATVPVLEADLPAVDADEDTDAAFVEVVDATMDVDVEREAPDGLRARVPL